MVDSAIERAIKERLRRSLLNADLRYSDPGADDIVKAELEKARLMLADCVRLTHNRVGPKDLEIRAGFDRERFMALLKGDVQ